MKQDYQNIDLNEFTKGPGGFFENIEVPYSKGREEAWEILEKRMEENSGSKVRKLWPRRILFSAAAAIILLAGTFSLLRFYSKSIYCPEGQHLSYILPDGSRVELNADSRLTFHPYWWRFSRAVNFDGEAYFEVEKGKKFSVVSETGTAEVLGTSFNIYSREKEYKVTCLTGKVKVTSFAAAETVLTPEYSARVSSSGEIVISKETKASDTHAWVNNMFSFTSRPLAYVFDEIGRQYNVSIILKSGADLLYSGYFTKNRPLEETLGLVCTPFGLTFARNSEKEYVISQN
jgi:ferric-dicitrate binding protein FerR (iron transport regulator)